MLKPRVLVTNFRKWIGRGLISGSELLLTQYLVAGVSGYRPGMPLQESLGYTDGTREAPISDEFRAATSTSSVETEK